VVSAVMVAPVLPLLLPPLAVSPPLPLPLLVPAVPLEPPLEPPPELLVEPPPPPPVLEPLPDAVSPGSWW
jgi:hypothetical protein